jgi:hypothetical protein
MLDENLNGMYKVNVNTFEIPEDKMKIVPTADFFSDSFSLEGQGRKNIETAA